VRGFTFFTHALMQSSSTLGAGLIQDPILADVLSRSVLGAFAADKPSVSRLARLRRSS
jgi:hypothetical protein